MDEPAHPPAFLDDRAILAISAQLRGMSHVTLRMVETDAAAEAELAALVRGLG